MDKENSRDTRAVTLMMFDTGWEAEIYRALLESAGVKAMLQNDILAGILPLNSVIRVRLYVLEEDLARAKEIIASHFDKEEFEAEARTERP